MSYRGQRVSSLPSELLLGLDYNPDTGEFSHEDADVIVRTYVCRPRNRHPFVLVRVGHFEVPAHRLVFESLGIAIGRLVIVHLNGDRLDNRLENLLPMTRGEANQWYFDRRNSIHGAGRKVGDQGDGSVSES